MVRRTPRSFLAALLAALVFAHAAFAEAGQSVWLERRRATAAPQPPRAPAPLPPRPLRSPPAPASALHAALPPAIGRLSTQPARGAARGTVVIVQDVHQNAEAQKNISAALRNLARSGLAPVIALEGASQTIDVRALRSFPHPGATRAAADYFLARHKISGAVYAALTAAPAPGRLVGIETAALYRQNADAARRARRARADAQARLARAAAGLEREAAAAPALARFHADVNRYHEGGAPLGEHISRLAAAVPAGPSMARFLAALAAERSLDFGATEREKSALLRFLADRLSAAEATRLAGAALAARAGTEKNAFASALERACDRHGVSLARFPALRAYLGYAALVDGINGDRLLAETAEAEAAGYAAAARTAAERALAARLRRLALARKLTAFGLTAREWSAYRALGRGPVEGVDVSAFEAFYRAAEARDDAMAANFLNTAKKGPAVLVAGGFHAGALREKLSAAGWTCATFTPLITHVEGDPSAYLSAFSRDKTPIEKLFAGEKLFLAQPPVADELTHLFPAAQVAGGVRNHPERAARLADWYRDARGGRGRLEAVTAGANPTLTFSETVAAGERRLTHAFEFSGDALEAIETVAVRPALEGATGLHFLPFFPLLHKDYSHHLWLGMAMIYAGAYFALALFAGDGWLPVSTAWSLVSTDGGSLASFLSGGIAGHAAYNALALRFGWARLSTGDRVAAAVAALEGNRAHSERSPAYADVLSRALAGRSKIDSVDLGTGPGDFLYPVQTALIQALPGAEIRQWATDAGMLEPGHQSRYPDNAAFLAEHGAGSMDLVTVNAPFPDYRVEMLEAAHALARDDGFLLITAGKTGLRDDILPWLIGHGYTVTLLADMPGHPAYSIYEGDPEAGTVIASRRPSPAFDAIRSAGLEVFSPSAAAPGKKPAKDPYGTLSQAIRSKLPKHAFPRLLARTAKREGALTKEQLIDDLKRVGARRFGRADDLAALLAIVNEGRAAPAAPAAARRTQAVDFVRSVYGAFWLRVQGVDLADFNSDAGRAVAADIRATIEAARAAFPGFDFAFEDGNDPRVPGNVAALLHYALHERVFLPAGLYLFLQNEQFSLVDVNIDGREEMGDGTVWILSYRGRALGGGEIPAAFAQGPFAFVHWPGIDGPVDALYAFLYEDPIAAQPEVAAPQLFARSLPRPTLEEARRWMRAEALAEEVRHARDNILLNRGGFLYGTRRYRAEGVARKIRPGSDLDTLARLQFENARAYNVRRYANELHAPAHAFARSQGPIFSFIENLYAVANARIEVNSSRGSVFLGATGPAESKRALALAALAVLTGRTARDLWRNPPTVSEALAILRAAGPDVNATLRSAYQSVIDRNFLPDDAFPDALRRALARAGRPAAAVAGTGARLDPANTNSLEINRALEMLGLRSESDALMIGFGIDALRHQPGGITPATLDAFLAPQINLGYLSAAQADAVRALFGFPPAPRPLIHRLTARLAGRLGFGENSAATALGFAPVVEGGIGFHFLPFFPLLHKNYSHHMWLGMAMIHAAAYVALALSAGDGWLSLPAVWSLISSDGGSLASFIGGGIAGHAAYNGLALWRRWAPLSIRRKDAERPGLAALALLVGKPADFDWNANKAALPSLEGLSLGETRASGRFNFTVRPGLTYKWNALGLPEPGWSGIVTKSGVRNGRYHFTVRFTKAGRSPIVRTFTIGPAQRTISLRTESGTVSETVWDVSDRAGLDALGPLVSNPPDHDWDAHRADVPALAGLEIGPIDKRGFVFFKTADGRIFRWFALGFASPGWTGTIVRSGVAFGRFRFAVDFRKPGEAGFRREFFIGPGSTIDYKPGLTALESLLGDPAAFPEKVAAGRLPELIGLPFGETHATGKISIVPAENFQFIWPALGAPDPGRRGTITQAYVAFRRLRIGVRFEKANRAPVLRVFEIGGGTRKLAGKGKAAGKRFDMLDIRLVPEPETVNANAASETVLAGRIASITYLRSVALEMSGRIAAEIAWERKFGPFASEADFVSRLRLSFHNVTTDHWRAIAQHLDFSPQRPAERAPAGADPRDLLAWPEFPVPTVALSPDEVRFYFGEAAAARAVGEGRSYFLRKLDPDADAHYLSEWKNEIAADAAWRKAWTDRGLPEPALPYFFYLEKFAVGLVSLAGGRERLEGFIGGGMEPKDFSTEKGLLFELVLPQVELYYRNVGADRALPGVADVLLDYAVKYVNEHGRFSRGIRLNAMTPGSRSLAERRGLEIVDAEGRFLPQTRAREEYVARGLDQRFNDVVAPAEEASPSLALGLSRGAARRLNLNPRGAAAEIGVAAVIEGGSGFHFLPFFPLLHRNYSHHMWLGMALIYAGAYLALAAAGEGWLNLQTAWSLAATEPTAALAFIAGGIAGHAAYNALARAAGWRPLSYGASDFDVSDLEIAPVRVSYKELAAYAGYDAAKKAKDEGRRFYIRQLSAVDDEHLIEAWTDELEADEEFRRAWDARGNDPLPMFKEFDYLNFGLVSELDGEERLEGYFGGQAVPADRGMEFAISQMEIYYLNIGANAALPGVSTLLWDYTVKLAAELDALGGTVSFEAATPGSDTLADRLDVPERGKYRYADSRYIARRYEWEGLDRRFNRPAALTTAFTRALAARWGWNPRGAAAEIALAPAIEGATAQHFLPWFPLLHAERSWHQWIGMALIYGAAIGGSFLAGSGLSLDGWSLVGAWAGGIAGHAAYAALKRFVFDARKSPERRMAEAVVDLAEALQTGRSTAAALEALAPRAADRGLAAATAAPSAGAAAPFIDANLLSEEIGRVRRERRFRAAAPAAWRAAFAATARVKGAQAGRLPDGNLLYPDIASLKAGLGATSPERHPSLYVLTDAGREAEVGAIARASGRAIVALARPGGFHRDGRLDFALVNDALASRFTRDERRNLSFAVAGGDLAALAAFVAALPDGSALRDLRFVVLDALLGAAVVSARDLIDASILAHALAARQA